MNPFRSGTGRHRSRKDRPGTVRTSALGLVLAAGTSVLSGGGIAQAAAMPAPAPAPGPAPAQDDEPDSPEPASVRHNSALVVIDNSGADSWLEVDRTLNMLLAGKGTAGSDHDGGGGAIDVHTRDVSGSDPAEIGHPPWQGENGD